MDTGRLDRRWGLLLLATGALLLSWILGACALSAPARAAADRAASSASPAKVGIGSSTKVGIASSKYLTSDPSRLTALGATWSYDWSATPPPADPRLQWVPMIWGSGSITPAVMASLRHDKQDGRAQYLLGFNEPDNGGQSNMTPAQAAALWPQLERTGLTLGSPAVATPTDGWLAQFMRLVRERHLRVNFIALHYYQDFTDPDAVSQLRAQLVSIHGQYHLPIWITEIGALNIRSWGETMEHAATAARAAVYMRELFAMLDSLPFVQRYAWFTDQCWNDAACHSSSLFNGSGRLTGLGREFAKASQAAR